MTTLIFIDANDERHTVDATDGDSVMATALAHGLDDIVAECGGSMMCATCHVFADPRFDEHLPDVSETENDLLDCTAVDRASNSRLSCQLVVSPALEGMEIHLPEAQ